MVTETKPIMDAQKYGQGINFQQYLAQAKANVEAHQRNHDTFTVKPEDA